MDTKEQLLQGLYARQPELAATIEDIDRKLYRYRTALAQIAALYKGEHPKREDYEKEVTGVFHYFKDCGRYEAAQIAQAALGEGEGKEVQGE